MVDKKVLMILAIVAVGLFAMPNILATYAGSHTIEIGAPNSTKGSAKALDCTECHQYIKDAATASTNSNVVYQAHLAAAGNVNYTTYLRLKGTDYTTNWETLNASNDGPLNGSAGNFAAYDAFFIVRNKRGNATEGGVAARNSATGNWNGINNLTGASLGTGNATEVYPNTEWRACLLCHQAPTGTHTRLEIKGCTNAYCHGSAEQASLATATVLNKAKTKDDIGMTLAKPEDAHSTWFERSNQEADEHKGSLGATNTKDYYTCLGCHTHVDVNLNIDKSTGFNMSLNNTDMISIVISDNKTTQTSNKVGGAFK